MSEGIQRNRWSCSLLDCPDWESNAELEHGRLWFELRLLTFSNLLNLN